MKQMIAKILTAAATCMIVMLAGCGKQVFTMSDNTEKKMVITAENARKDDFFGVGTLEVDKGELIIFTSALTKGEIRVELTAAPDSISAEDVPAEDNTVLVSFDASGTKTETVTIAPGAYMLNVTCTRKATGTVTVEAKASE